MTREEAIKELEKESCYECSWGCESPVKCTCPKCNLIDAIKMSIEALKEQRPSGEWKPLGEPDELGIHLWHICSSCGFRTTWHMVDIFHFCPNCGADMRKERG